MAQLKILIEELDAVETQFSTMAPDATAAFPKMIQEFRDQGMDNGLSVGVKAPNFKLEEMLMKKNNII